MTPDYEKWASKFRRSRNGKAAIASLQKLSGYGDPKEFELLTFLILQNCCEAHVYDQKSIAGRLQEKRDYQKNVPDQIKAAKAVSRFAHKYFDESAHQFHRAVEALEQQHNISFPKRVNWSVILQELMNRYADNLTKSGPSVSRFIGPFLYPRTVKDQTHLPNLASLGLLFHLVLLFRDWTATGKIHVHGNGHKMPKHGRACYKQATLFHNAALSKILTVRQAQDRLIKLIRNNPGIGICSWPHYQA